MTDTVLNHLPATPDAFEPGQIVIARFTNSHRVHQFLGRIERRTKNDWKVVAITSPYPQEAPGRVFRVATFESRIYSQNNRIIRLATPAEIDANPIPEVL